MIKLNHEIFKRSDKLKRGMMERSVYKLAEVSRYGFQVSYGIDIFWDIMSMFMIILMIDIHLGYLMFIGWIIYRINHAKQRYKMLLKEFGEKYV